MIATLPNRERPRNFDKLVNLWHSFYSLSWTFCCITCSWSQEKWTPKVITPEHHSRLRGVSKEFLLFPIHIAFVFERLKPEYFSKSLRVCITFSTDEILASVAVMSSACNKRFSFIFPDFYPFDLIICSYSIFTIQYPVPLFSLCTKSLIAVFKDAKQLSEENGGGPFC